MERKKRYYSLFEKREGKWVRISVLALHKPMAVLVYQAALLDPVFTGGAERSLRVVPPPEGTPC